MAPEDESTREDEAQTAAQPHGFKFASGKSISGTRFKVSEALFHNTLGEVYRVNADNGGIPYNLRWFPGVTEEAAKSLTTLSALPSRNLINILDFKALDGGVVVATEPYQRNLRGVLQESGRSSPEVAGDRITCVLHALVALENANIFPVVVSPESIAVWEDGAALDEYYLSRLFPPGRQPVPLDRAAYLPPDLDPGEPNPSDALYGVGATLYEMLTGVPHLKGAPFEVINRAVREDFRVDIPGPLGDLVRRLLAPKGARRFNSAEDVIRLLSDQQAAISIGEIPLPSAEAGGQALDDGNQVAGSRLRFLETNEQGYKVFLREPDEVRMVLLPGGGYAMGSSKAEEFGRTNEAPVVHVAVGAFLIDETPVTWADLTRLLQRAGSGHPLNSDAKNFLPAPFGGSRDPGYDSRWYNHRDLFDKLAAEQPAILVSHEEASMLAELLEVQLPSEAQWEFAHRGGTSTEYYWGDNVDPERAWFSDNASAPQAVRQLPANPFGLYDMAGNVAEFCRDYYHKDAYERAATADPDPQGLSMDQLASGIAVESNRFSLRGGSWSTSARSVRAAFRADTVADRPTLTNGFRFVIDGAAPPDWAAETFGNARAATEAGTDGEAPAAADSPAVAEPDSGNHDA